MPIIAQAIHLLQDLLAAAQKTKPKREVCSSTLESAPPGARGLIALAGIGSALLLTGAFGFQYLGGLAPCSLCVWQRWPHAIAALISVLAVTLPKTFMTNRMHLAAGLGGALMLGSAALAGYHAGIERGLWPGSAACTMPVSTDIDTDKLLDRILEAPIVRCDEVAWQMLGLSMAEWNAIASLALAGVWFWSMHTGRQSKIEIDQPSHKKS